MLYGQSIPHDHTPSSFKRMPNKRKLPKVAQKKIENSFLVPVTGLQRKVRLLQYLNHCASFNQRMTFILVKTKLI